MSFSSSGITGDDCYYEKGATALTLPPWKIVPLFQNNGRLQLERLPGFDTAKCNPLASCFVMDNFPAQNLPQVQKLLHRVTRNDATQNLWDIYTLVATINLVLQQDWEELSKRSKSESDGQLEIADTKDDDEEDNDDEMGCEAWTWIQDSISWTDWQVVYRHVQQYLCIVAAPHPLETYAIEKAPLLTRDQVIKAVECLGLQAQFYGSPNDQQKPNDNNSLPPQTGSTMAMRLSQLLKDLYPPQNYGVLFYCYNNNNIPADESTAATTVKKLSFGSFRHACLPNAALEIKSPTQIHLVVLYNDVSRDEEMEIGTVPLDGASLEQQARRRCRRECNPCILCRHGDKHDKHDNGNTRSTTPINPKSSTTNRSNLDWNDLTRLGHYFFQKEHYPEATRCYRLALKENETLDDVRHALGALELARGYFLQAQITWNNAATIMSGLGRDPKRHQGIHLQLKKNQAYRYLDDDDATNSPPTTTTSIVDIRAKYPYRAYFNKQCFVTPMLDEATCKRLIQIATTSGKWTTGRHYAVPTNDIPVHEVPELLQWFYPWMERECGPLLKEQFGQKSNQRFYVHDAFFVRYQGGGDTNHLPCHFDECTHSFVICLNDDFEGGGTYFHDYNTVLSPRVGEVVTFKGDSLRHGGDAVTRGTRYILAVFLYLDQPCSDATHSQPNSGKGECSTSDGGGTAGSKHQIQELFHEAKKGKSDFSFGFHVEGT